MEKVNDAHVVEFIIEAEKLSKAELITMLIEEREETRKLNMELAKSSPSIDELFGPSREELIKKINDLESLVDIQSDRIELLKKQNRYLGNRLGLITIC